MPSTVEFPFSDDEALPKIPITLSHADSSSSTISSIFVGVTPRSLRLATDLPFPYFARSTNISALESFRSRLARAC
jgi:hypothetical protein